MAGIENPREEGKIRQNSGIQNSSTFRHLVLIRPPLKIFVLVCLTSFKPFLNTVVPCDLMIVQIMPIFEVCLVLSYREK